VQFKLARAVNAKKAVDLGPTIGEMGAAWDRAMAALVER
jgi:hypothetical protein